MNASTLRALVNNTSGALMVEVVNESGFAVSGESVTFTANGTTSEVLTDSYGVATLNLDGDSNSGSAAWADQTVSVQGVVVDSLPAIVGYEGTFLLPMSRLIPCPLQMVPSTRTTPNFGGSLKNVGNGAKRRYTERSYTWFGQWSY